MFSTRVPTNRTPNRVTEAIRRARAACRRIIDLTLANPTRAGFDYDPILLQPLASARGFLYSPQPFGLPEARHAVAREYARRDIDVALDRIVLTASTSEAYSLLFRLLCDGEGHAVRVPVPSYPLFEHLTRLDGVRPIPYRLEYHGRWIVDMESVDGAWTDSVRALLAVSPNNPTGSVLSPAELDVLSTRCAERDAALILDEVFADYPLSPASPPPSRASDIGALTFRLGGLSKSAGLPQVKLGWLAVDGPDALVAEALDRLELICDTYLSVSTPVQVAAAALLESGVAVRHQIQERIGRNYRTLQDQASQYPAVEVLHADAGWSAVIRVPSLRTEEEIVLALLEQDEVLVHPGFFFDFPHEAFLVVSLLPEAGGFSEGVRRVMERVNG